MSTLKVNRILDGAGNEGVNADIDGIANLARGLTGDPNINVGILTVTGDLTVSGNISAAGTITYEDVTNVDSIGIVTARSGIRVGAANSIGIGTEQPASCLDLSNETSGIALPQGTTAQRPVGNYPFLRKNTTNNALEYYDGTSWVEIITDYFPNGSVILG